MDVELTGFVVPKLFMDLLTYWQTSHVFLLSNVWVGNSPPFSKEFLFFEVCLVCVVSVMAEYAVVLDFRLSFKIAKVYRLIFVKDFQLNFTYE